MQIYRNLVQQMKWLERAKRNVENVRKLTKKKVLFSAL